MRRRVWVLILVSLAVASCNSGDSSETASTSSTAAPVTDAEDPAGVVVKSDLAYLSWNGVALTLDLHVPGESAGAPIVISPPLSAVDGLVAEGAIVVTLDEEDDFGYEWPRSAEAILSDPAAIRAWAEKNACAIHLARARASELGSDDPIVVLSGWGGAAGGIAAHVALFGDTFDARWDEFAAASGPPRQFDCVVTDGSTHVDAVLPMGGSYDVFVPIFDGTWGRAFQQEQFPAVHQFLSSSIGANPDLKVRLIHGTTDPISAEYAAELAETLTDAGYDVQFIPFEGGHVPPPAELYLSTVLEVLDR